MHCKTLNLWSWKPKPLWGIFSEGTFPKRLAVLGFLSTELFCKRFHVEAAVSSEQAALVPCKIVQQQSIQAGREVLLRGVCVLYSSEKDAFPSERANISLKIIHSEGEIRELIHCQPVGTSCPMPERNVIPQTCSLICSPEVGGKLTPTSISWKLWGGTKAEAEELGLHSQWTRAEGYSLGRLHVSLWGTDACRKAMVPPAMCSTGTFEYKANIMKSL